MDIQTIRKHRDMITRGQVLSLTITSKGRATSAWIDVVSSPADYVEVIDRLARGGNASRRALAARVASLFRAGDALTVHSVRKSLQAKEWRRAGLTVQATFREDLTKGIRTV